MLVSLHTVTMGACALRYYNVTPCGVVIEGGRNTISNSNRIIIYVPVPRSVDHIIVSFSLLHSHLNFFW